MEVRPVIGGDGKTPVTLTSPLHSTLMQGETVLGALASPHRFSMKGTNGFYNWSCKMKGSL